MGMSTGDSHIEPWGVREVMTQQLGWGTRCMRHKPFTCCPLYPMWLAYVLMWFEWFIVAVCHEQKPARDGDDALVVEDTVFSAQVQHRTSDTPNPIVVHVLSRQCIQYLLCTPSDKHM